MTKNKVMSTKWFTNMYQELDRATLYFGNCIVDTVLKGVAFDKNIIDQELVEKVLFRSIVYRLIYKVHNCYSAIAKLRQAPAAAPAASFSLGWLSIALFCISSTQFHPPTCASRF